MSKMVVCDFSAIEYNIVGWLSRCSAIRKVIHEKKDPYLDFATKLYANRGLTYEQLEAEYKSGIKEYRQNSKPAVLGGGFGLGGGEEKKNEFGDMVRTGMYGYALNVCGVDMSLDMAHEAIRIYRKVNWEVPIFWTDMEMAFKSAIRYPKSTFTVGKITWNKDIRDWVDVARNDERAFIAFSCVQSESIGNIVRMRLPSGRYLHYLDAHIEREKFQYVDKETGEKKTAYGDVIYYQGIEHSATDDAEGATAHKQMKWGWVKTYGGKLTENGVSAVARDALVHSCHLAEGMGFQIFGLFHDEIAAEVNDKDWDSLGVEDLRWAMNQPPVWAPTMILDSAGWEGKYYKKA